MVSDSGLTVCDKNSGFTWEQRPTSLRRTWQESIDYCPTLGAGWALPEFDLLQTLVDTTASTCTAGGMGALCLPDGHPFDNVQSSFYWSATTSANNTVLAETVWFLTGDMTNFLKTGDIFGWCARSDS